jgi:hypothetical protein
MKWLIHLVFGFFAVVVVAAIASHIITSAGTTSSAAHVTTSTAAETTSSPGAATPQKPQTFKGSGSENIGTISVSVPSTLRWSCATCNVFGVGALSTHATHTITVDAQGRTGGVTAVEPGTYHSVSVSANEVKAGKGWTIRVTAGQ